MKRTVTAMFGVCFAAALFAASHAQIGPAPGSSGAGTPGGIDTQVQFNDGGAFGGDTGLVYNKTTNLLTIVNGLFTLQWGATANDIISTNSSGTLFTSTNAGGTKLQLVTADSAEGLRFMSTANFAWNSTTNLNGGAIDTALNRNAAGVVEANNGTAGTYREVKLRSLVVGGTVPGISGCSAGTQTGGATAGTYSSGTSGACTVVLTFAFTAPTGWSCATNNQTTAVDPQRQSASTTTTATITGTTVTGDVINFHCMAY